MSPHPPNIATYLRLVILDYKASKDSVLDGICASDHIRRMDGRTHGQTMGKHNTRKFFVAGYEYCLSVTHSSGITKTCALSHNYPLLTN